MTSQSIALKIRSQRLLFYVSITVGLFPSVSVATEGALGRPVAGAGVVPNIGIVSPEPITAVSIQTVYMDGKIGASRAVPIGGETTLGVRAKFSLTTATIMKVWDTGGGRWNFASAATLPFAWSSVKASVQTGRRAGSRSDESANLFDIYVSPLIAGYHFSQTEHLAISANFWAPTGKYDQSRLSNPSLNNWTFVPQIAFTKIMPEQQLQFDAVTGVQFYTKNSATDYRNAPLFTFDLMGRKTFKNGFGAGLVLGTVQQLGDDKGPTADRLNGFRGRDWALGPIVTYDAKLQNDRSLSLALRWVPTISSTNRLDSNSTVVAAATLVF